MVEVIHPEPINEEDVSLPDFYTITLPLIAEKLHSLLGEQPHGGKRRPVNCVAFSYHFVSTDDDNRIAAYHYPICLHPVRGKQDGCLLAEEDEVGTITRLRGARCEYRVKEKSKGSVALAKVINEQEELKF